jgi:hypothetical protein
MGIIRVNMKNSIAILYIALGKYDVFWDDFYKSCEQYFCPGDSKYYFVFTDSDHIKNGKNVRKIYQDDLGWPFSTMYRYKFFLRIKDELAKFSHVVYLNGNCEFMTSVSAQDFFGIESQSLVACLHPGYFDAKPSSFTTERRFASSAFILSPKKYYAGGINGGTASIFIGSLEQLNGLIESDLKNGILAVWHDESYWNAFLAKFSAEDGNYLHELDPGFLHPDQWKLPFSMKIKLRNKSDYLDIQSVKSEVKHQKLSFFEKIVKKFS